MPDRAVVVRAAICPQCGDNESVREVWTHVRGGDSPRWWCEGCEHVWEDESLFRLHRVDRQGVPQPQPRAVVDEDWVEGVEKSIASQLEANTYTLSPPRALVALSEDRQWLVVLGAEPDPEGKRWWRFIQWVSPEDGYWEYDEFWQDDGQDAHAVLASWLEGRGG